MHWGIRRRHKIMYNETLRRDSHSDHEEHTARTKSYPFSTSTPHPSPIVPTEVFSFSSPLYGLKVLDPLQSCEQAGESSSRCF